MSFSMVDRITGWEQGKWIETVKALSLSEEYLADHFPGFPVMPGVLMLETLIQSASWLLRFSRGFHKIFPLRNVRAVRYGNFVKPGSILAARVEIVKSCDDDLTFKGTGLVGGKTAVTGRFILAVREAADFQPSADKASEEIEGYYRKILASHSECKSRTLDK
jgi:3-hydroxyacyl-[acyl-carrier-protein] dehydratase